MLFLSLIITFKHSCPEVPTVMVSAPAKMAAKPDSVGSSAWAGGSAYVDEYADRIKGLLDQCES